MKVVNWNVQWASESPERARKIRKELDRVDADVVCLTEGSLDLLPAGGGSVESESDYGYRVQETRRKVILWSRRGFHPWNNSSPVGMPGGRFANGVATGTELVVVGVCIPWWAAHVSTGRRDRKPWEDHRNYLIALRSFLDTQSGKRVLVVGDFNQSIPRRSHVPQAIYHEFLNTFRGLDILTAYQAAPSPLIDHLAVTPGLLLEALEYLPKLSDHVGWSACVHVA